MEDTATVNLLFTLWATYYLNKIRSVTTVYNKIVPEK